MAELTVRNLVKQQHRLALNFFGPIFLAGLPMALRCAWAASREGEYSVPTVFLAFEVGGLFVSGIPAFASAYFIEWAILKRIDHRSGWFIGLLAIYGSISGVAISLIFLRGQLVQAIAISNFFAWGLISLLVRFLDSRKQIPNHSPEPAARPAAH